MTVVFVTGVHKSGKNEILKMVLRRSEKHKLDYMTFDGIMKPLLKKTKLMLNIDKIKADQIRIIQEHMNKELNKVKWGGNILLSGYLTLRTPHGYMPLIDNNTVNLISPDVIILIELETDPSNRYVRHLMHKSPGTIEKVRQHQLVNRQYAILYSSMCGAIVKTIKIEHGNIKKVVSETSDAIRFFMGD